MNVILIILSALLPVAILLLYITRKDPQPEPISWLLKSFIYGTSTVIPILIVEFLLKFILFGAEGNPSNIIGTTVEAFVVAALPEESFKLLALWLILRKNPYFDEHIDGIVYAVCVGLGFAAIENVMFIAGEDSWQSVAISRALFAVPGHYAFAVLMGYYYSLYHFVDKSTKNAILVLVAPVMAHGIYDSIVMGTSVNPYIGIAGTFALIYFCVKLHKHANKRIVSMIEKDNATYFNS